MELWCTNQAKHDRCQVYRFIRAIVSQGVVALEVYSRGRQPKVRYFFFVRTTVNQGGDLWDDVSKLIEMLGKFGTPK